MQTWRDGEVDRSCPVCGAMGVQDEVLEVPGPHGMVLVARCRTCASLTTDAAPLAMTEHDADIDSYLEATAGIGSIIERLTLVPASARSLLDVGCGYGFGVDIGTSIFGWRSVGIEPSAAGRRGAREMGIDIVDGILGTDVLPQGPFDAAFASEVLEHVTDPAALLVAMRSQLSPTGCVVLTTPAAEAITAHATAQTISEVLSVPYHHFVASLNGLRALLENSGFGAVEVRRQAATLIAVARVSPETVETGPSRSVSAADSERYLLDRAARADRGSALELGCLVRAYRSMVARGAFDEAESMNELLTSAFEYRSGQVFAVERLGEALDGGWSPLLSLPGAAFATGMIALLQHRDPASASQWFVVAEQAATRLRHERRLADLDSLDLVVQSLGHGALCAAATGEPTVDAAVALLDRLGDVISSDDLDWWRCRVFVEAVSAGRYDGAALLLGSISLVAHSMAMATFEARRRTGLDTLFTWGILCLQRQELSMAAQLFGACAVACRAALPGDHPQHLLDESLRHVQLIRDTDAGTDAPSHRHRHVGEHDVHAVVETYWCDARGFYIAGWLASSGLGWERIGVRTEVATNWSAPTARPDVRSLFADLTDDRVGFERYVTDRPPASIQIVGRSTDGVEYAVGVDVPDRPLPLIDVAERPLDVREVMTDAPDGPVLVIGARVAEGIDPTVEVLRQIGREVVSVDIHPGLGVDVVADAHDLPNAFALGTFALTYSSNVLEHLLAPWVVARSCAAVTMTGGLAVHAGPFVWPEHAQPNDFWRFSPAGLRHLFGPSAGFEVLDSGGDSPASVVPLPSWLARNLAMPTLLTMAQSWVVARRTHAPVPAGAWLYDREAGAATARAYPVDALASRFVQ